MTKRSKRQIQSEQAGAAGRVAKIANQDRRTQTQRELDEALQELEPTRRELEDVHRQLDEAHQNLQLAYARIRELEKLNQDLDGRLTIVRQQSRKKSLHIGHLNKNYQRQIKRLKRDRKAFYHLDWALEKSRNEWKNKRRPSKRDSRENRNTILNAAQDLQFKIQFGVTGRARKRMKAFMRSLKVDFFALNRERDELIQSNCPNEEWTYEKFHEKGVLYRNNIVSALMKRLEHLIDNEKLMLSRDDPTPDIYICITGDTGNDITKIGSFFLDLNAANDPDNISLLCFYEGVDTADMLRLNCVEVFDQLNDLHGKILKIPVKNANDGATMNVKVNLFICGDMPFLLNVYGLPHQWLRKEPCLYCHVSKDDFTDRTSQLRSLKEMLIAHREGKQKYCPALIIPIENAVPSTLHTIMGIISDYFKRVEEAADDEIYEKIQEILRVHRIDKQAWFMIFTAMEKFSKKIAALFSETHAEVVYCINVMKALAKVQACTKSKFLMEDDLEELNDSIENLRNVVFSHAKPRITAKMHWVLEHVVPFADLHGFWGKGSEQPIEHLHKKMNEDLRQFSATKDNEVLYRQIAQNQCMRNYFYDSKA